MASNITTPVGRLVGGSLYEAETTDALGNPLTIKTGANAGQPTQRYTIGVAITKTAGVDWKQEPWGQIIVAEAMASFRNNEFNRPDFAWKVKDGDDNTVNKAGRKNSDNPNYKNCWILWFSSQFAPQVFNADGSQRLLEKDYVKLGYYIQVAGTVAGNGNLQNAGVFLNGSMVAFSAYGEEIQVGLDATAVGFGGSPLPAGASAAPVGGAFNPAAPAAPAPAAPVPAAPVPAAPVPAAPVPAAPQFIMTAAANGLTREQYHSGGWTDEQLIAHGLMQQVQPHTGILQA